MNKYMVEIHLTDGRRVVETICAIQKSTAHALAFRKYGDLYAASVILQEAKNGVFTPRCQRCGNLEHLPGAKFCMICGMELELTSASEED